MSATSASPTLFSPKRLIILAIFIPVLLVLFFLPDDIDLLTILQTQYGQLTDFIAANWWAPLLFIIAYALTVAFSLPFATPLSIGAGLIFGTLMGTIYVVIAATLGASALFLAVRYGLGDVFGSQTGPKIEKMRNFVQKNAFAAILFMRLMPLFPFFLVNIAPASFGISFSAYFWATLIGIIPGTAVFVSFGGASQAVIAQGGTLSLDNLITPDLLFGLAGLATLALLPILLKPILQKYKLI